MTNFPKQVDMANLVTATILGALKTADNLIDKAKAHAAEKGIKDEVLLNARLIADMFPFVRQIQIVSDNAKGAFARLSGETAPTFEDKEASFDELKQRIAKTREFVISVDASKIIGTEEKEVVLRFGELVFPFVGYSYVVGFLIPNINFHLSTAYGILRANGVNLGKSDYLVQ